MALPIIGDAMKGLFDLVGKFKSSPEEKYQQAALEMEPLILQLQANLAQEQHKSVFVAGARPFVIWICAFGLMYSTIVYQVLLWTWAFMKMDGTPPPQIDASTLTIMLTSLLGIGGMRSYDKKQGTETNKIK